MADIRDLPLFLVSVVLSFLINWLIAALFGMIAFTAVNISALIQVKKHLLRLLSGSIIPVWFFPDSVARVLSALPFVTINSGSNCSPYVMNISIQGIRSEIMLHFLESRHVYVSSGSACSKGKTSRVLTEMGLDAKLADTSLRISFSKMSAWGEIDLFVTALREGYMKLEKTS